MDVIHINSGDMNVIHTTINNFINIYNSTIYLKGMELFWIYLKTVISRLS